MNAIKDMFCFYKGSGRIKVLTPKKVNNHILCGLISFVILVEFLIIFMIGKFNL